ncbi:uncharacterized protein MYCFIDRAFT_29854, partial [Pseudocercospora fijiensis CIRAD86]
EGTVCSIAFVKDTLFPYAIKALPQVLATKWEEPEFAQYRDAFPEEHRQSPGALQAHVEDLTKRDVKIAYLKNLQGYLWETGYKTGAYGTELFPDVVPQLRQWRDSGFELAIYSSGSIFAQKLLFGHVQVASGTAASSSPHWFDTTNAGLKTESTSYSKIAEALKRKPEEVLFLSDNVKEVDAAIEAGMKSIVVDRPGNAPLADADKERLQIVTSLADVHVSKS